MIEQVFEPKEMHAIQLALQDQINFIKKALTNNMLNDLAVEQGKDLLLTSQLALIKSIAAYGQFSPLGDGEPTEEDIKKYIKQ